MTGAGDQSQAGRWWAAARRLWVHPFVSAVLACGLFVDGVAQPEGTFAHGLLNAPFVGCRLPARHYVVQDGASWRPVNDGDFVGYNLNPALRSVNYIHRTSLCGPWAPTERVTRVFCFDDSALNVPDRSAIDTVIAAQLLQDGVIDGAEAVGIRSGGRVVSTPLPGGYAHNAAAAFGMGALALSLGWVGPLIRRASDQRGRRLAAGRCPKCLYDLRGLPADQCPECGEMFRAQ